MSERWSQDDADLHFDARAALALSACIRLDVEYVAEALSEAIADRRGSIVAREAAAAVMD